jgi:hypothetical protein
MTEAQTRNKFKPPAIARLDRSTGGVNLASPNCLTRMRLALLVSIDGLGARVVPDLPVDRYGIAFARLGVLRVDARGHGVARLVQRKGIPLRLRSLSLAGI